MATRNESSTPWMATHPGTILKYELDERELTQKDFAVLMGMQKSHVSELIKGKRPMTKAIADKIEEKLGLSSVSLLNLQTQYDYDVKVLKNRDVEEQKALNILKLYDEFFDVNIVLKRSKGTFNTAVEKVSFLREVCQLQKPEDFKSENAGTFRRSVNTGLDSRMLMTWKILAENKARTQSADAVFNREEEDVVISQLAHILHENLDVVNRVRTLLSQSGIVFCIEEKVDRASVDGYSYIENGTPYIILTNRYNRIDHFAFALMHEIGHIYIHYTDNSKEKSKLSIPDYDNQGEKEANEFAASALIPKHKWKNAPKVRVNPLSIQRAYTSWAEENGMNKWIVLGRISYETGMNKFKPDECRNIG